MLRTSAEELLAVGRLSTRMFHWLFAGKIGQRLADGSECPDASWPPTTTADVTSAASNAIRRIAERLPGAGAPPFGLTSFTSGYQRSSQFGPPTGGVESGTATAGARRRGQRGRLPTRHETWCARSFSPAHAAGRAPGIRSAARGGPGAAGAGRHPGRRARGRRGHTGRPRRRGARHGPRSGVAEQALQVERVVHRVCAPVVVEVGEHLGALAPAADARGPFLQLARGVVPVAAAVPVVKAHEGPARRHLI